MDPVIDQDQPEPNLDLAEIQPGKFGKLAEALARQTTRRALLRRGLRLAFATAAAVAVQGSFSALQADASSPCTFPGGTCASGLCSGSGIGCTGGCGADSTYHHPGNCWSTVYLGFTWMCCDCWCPIGPCNLYSCGCQWRLHSLANTPDTPRMSRPAQPTTMTIPDC